MSWRDSLPAVRGKLLRDEPLGPFTWFRVGGPADVLFLPQDQADLAAFLKALDPAVPVTVLGVGSNVIVRDGGVEGVVIRLGGRGFARFAVFRTRSASSPALRRADAAGARSRPRPVSPAWSSTRAFRGSDRRRPDVMNAGCYGSETRDVLVAAWGHEPERRDADLMGDADLSYSYRHSARAAAEWT